MAKAGPANIEAAANAARLTLNIFCIFVPFEIKENDRSLSSKSTVGNFESSMEHAGLRKGEATRARILEEAGRQAAIKGLAGVSLNDVAEAVGLSKSGLFKHFESKEAMQAELLNLVLNRFVDIVWKPAEDKTAGRERLEAVFENWLRWCDIENAASGCPIAVMSIELDDQPGPLRDHLQASQARWYRTLARDFKAMRDPPLSNEEAELAVFQLKSFIFGHREHSRLLENGRDARTMTRAAFKALMERTERG